MRIFKKLLLFAFIVSLFMTVRVPLANAYSQAVATWYATHCVTETAIVTIDNPPAGKTVFLGCSGDKGSSNGLDADAVESASGPYNVCVANCNGKCTVCTAVDNKGNCTATKNNYKGPTYWCSGNIQPAIIGGKTTLPNCSCANPTDHGCLKVLLSSTNPTMNTCARGANPTVVTTGMRPEDSGCNVTETGPMCGSNGQKIEPVIKIVCPTATPTVTPTLTPTLTPAPTVTPTLAPTVTPTVTPTLAPTVTPTVTPIPHSTTLSFVIGLDGIGTTGDQLNPAYSILKNAANEVVAVGSTPNPVHATRPIAVLIVNSNHQTTEYDGDITYDSTATSDTYGKFTGSIDLGIDFQAGNYEVIASVGAHLKKSLGNLDITHIGQDNHIGGTPKNLTAGDITGDTPKDTGRADNHLDILDYNVLMSCIIYTHGSDRDLCNSRPQFFTLSDLEDNGNTTADRGPQVDEFDYNLFLRELSANPNGDNPPETAAVQAQAAQAQTAALDTSVVVDTALPTETPTLTPTPTIDQTAEPTATLTPTPTVDQTTLPTETPTLTPTPTIDQTAEPTATLTPTTAPQPTSEL